MKSISLLFVCVALALQAPTGRADYRSDLESAHKRFRDLEVELRDFRKPRPELPPEQEAEYLRLLGQLMSEDPVWALTRQIQADIDALVAIRQRTPEEGAILESLKELLAVVSTIQERATTRPEAEKLATAMRQFTIKRDVSGARAWLTSREN